MAKIGQFLAGQCSGRPCTNLMQHSEPIFQVPGVRNALVLKVMKLMQRDQDWLSRRLQAKEFPLDESRSSAPAHPHDRVVRSRRQL